MNRKISVGMAVTIVILAMTVTFSITMLIAMRLFDSTVSSVKEKESMYNKVAEVDRYVRSNDYYPIDETVLYDRLTAGYLLGHGRQVRPLLQRHCLHGADESAERQGDGHWRGAGHRPDRLRKGDQGLRGLACTGGWHRGRRLYHRH